MANLLSFFVNIKRIKAEKADPLSRHHSHGPTILDTDPFVDEDAEYHDEEVDEPLILRLDPELVTAQSIQWITRRRIVGLNKESRSGKHCFISGEGTCDDTGVFFAWDCSSDPAFPDDDQLVVALRYVPEFRVCPRHDRYRWPEDGNFFPLHSACYKVLKALASGRLGDRDIDHGDVDATMLFSFFRYACFPHLVHPGPSPPHTLTLTYIDVDMGYDEGSAGQFWEFRRGEELREYYDNLPLLPDREQEVLSGIKRKIDGCIGDDSFQHSQQTQLDAKRHKSDQMHRFPTHASSYNEASRDLLGLLPPEIFIDVFIHLPAQSIVNMMIASPTARHIRLSNWFWWKRIQSAMPCLWDLPSFHGSANIDCCQVYEDLSTQGRGHGHWKILGLVNRHRIWQLWDPAMRTWFEERSSLAEQDVTEAIREWGDRESFREWRAAREQTMSGAVLLYGDD